jgi:CRP/FNR family transcriptional regulator, cyclic AMP receptor protein
MNNSVLTSPPLYRTASTLALNPTCARSHHRQAKMAANLEDSLSLVTVSSALVPMLRGRFCDTLLKDRAVLTFEDGQVLYDVDETERTLWFIRTGVVKVGSILDDGRELIYDVRKDGDVVGELSLLFSARKDRAVAVERTQATPAPFDEVIAVLSAHPDLLRDLIGVFCGALADAYDQVTRLAVKDVMHRLRNVLKTLAEKLGEARGDLVEIAAYLTQEELAQMVVARRERVSTALNVLRQGGVVQYSPRGRLIVDVNALSN